jgi:hypothetical protein
MSKESLRRFTLRKKVNFLGGTLTGWLNWWILRSKPVKTQEAGQVDGPSGWSKRLLIAGETDHGTFGAYAECMASDKQISFTYARLILGRIQDDLRSIGFDDAEWQSFSQGYEMYIGGACIARGIDPDPATAAENLIDYLADVFAEAPKA